MQKFTTKYISNIFTQLIIYFTINGFFIFKYVPRYGLNAYLAFALFLSVTLSGLFFYRKIKLAWKERTFKLLFFLSLSVMIAGIIVSLVLIDPYSIRVDRWSALSFFWDSVFAGIYPYATHTHTCPTNFASPFPFWHFIHLPFYLMRDVGIGIIFFLILTAFATYKYFGSFKTAIIFLFLLLISPAYWWEIAVRSDGLSNTLLVMMFVMWCNKTGKNISTNFYMIAIICGLFCATRFSALLPLALFLFHPYIKDLTLKQKVVFPLITLLIATLWFLPFIFWDTKNWIFFSRNPFMSQTINGDTTALIILFFIGLYLSLSWKNIQQYFAVTSFFIFIFMLIMQVIRMIKNDATFFGDAIVDISYFTLALPYCISFATLHFKENGKISHGQNGLTKE